MPNQNKPSTATPPIPDVNHNGILDGEDILAQFAKEDVGGNGERNATQHGHGVFEMLGLRAETLDITTHSLAGIALTPDAFQKIAKDLSQLTQEAVGEVTASLAKDPKAGENDLTKMLAAAKAQGASPEILSLLAADQQSYVDFAKTFGATFPKGVHIEAKDIPPILSHFGTLLIAVPKAPSPTKAKKVPQNVI